MNITILFICTKTLRGAYFPDPDFLTEKERGSVTQIIVADGKNPLYAAISNSGKTKAIHRASLIQHVEFI